MARLLTLIGCIAASLAAVLALLIAIGRDGEPNLLLGIISGIISGILLTIIVETIRLHLVRRAAMRRYTNKNGYTILPRERHHELHPKAHLIPDHLWRPHVHHAFAWKRRGHTGEVATITSSTVLVAPKGGSVMTACFLTLGEHICHPYMLVRAQRPGRHERAARAVTPWNRFDARSYETASGRRWVLISSDMRQAKDLVPHDLLELLDSLPWQTSRGTPTTILELLGPSLKLAAPAIEDEEGFDRIIEAAIAAKEQLIGHHGTEHDLLTQEQNL